MQCPRYPKECSRDLAGEQRSLSSVWRLQSMGRSGPESGVACKRTASSERRFPTRHLVCHRAAAATAAAAIDGTTKTEDWLLPKKKINPTSEGTLCNIRGDGGPEREDCWRGPGIKIKSRESSPPKLFCSGYKERTVDANGSGYPHPHRSAFSTNEGTGKALVRAL